MPKTFTDDVGAALPSSIDGPFQVHDPKDIDSYLKIDPEAGSILAGGDARPVRQVRLGYSRAYFFSTTTVLGSALDARSLQPSVSAGVYATPFQIPFDMDVAEPSSVKVIVAPASDGGGATVVRFEVVASHGKDGDTSIADKAATYDWTTPAGWTTEDLKLVAIDEGSGYTFPGSTFESDDIVGLRVHRAGGAAEDTFPHALIMAMGFLFAYIAKEL